VRQHPNVRMMREDCHSAPRREHQRQYFGGGTPPWWRRRLSLNRDFPLFKHCLSLVKLSLRTDDRLQDCRSALMLVIRCWRVS
jgi:hypothetical protein